jgi:cobaltochelatase CobS
MSKTIKELESLKTIEMDAGKVFSGKKSGCKIIGYEKPISFTPEVDKNYIFQPG